MDKLNESNYYQPLLTGYKRRDRFSRYRIREVFEIYEPQKGERVLDMGCGVGTFSLELAKRGIAVVGLDNSLEAIGICRNLAEELGLNIDFVLADVHSTHLPSATFDTVVCADLVEHIVDADKLMGEVKRLLKTGGNLVIWTPNPGHIFELLKKRNLLLKRDETHIGYKTLNELKDLLLKHGFDIHKAYHKESHVWGFNLLEKLLQRIIPFLRRRNAVLAINNGLGD